MSEHKTLLIVDDSAVSRMMIKAIVVDKHPEWTILEAENGQNALEAYQGNNIDFYSVDLNMPGMDGLELISQLQPENPDAVFALMTANIQEATHKKCDDLGIECIHKPVTEKSINQMMEIFGASV